MKILNNYKFLVLGFIAGLIIMGVGAGVGFFEFQSMTYCGEKEVGTDKLIEKEVTVKLPDTFNILYYEYGYKIKIEPDSSLDPSTAKAVIKTKTNENINLCFETPRYIYNYTDGHISKQKYSEFIPKVFSSNNWIEFETFKTFLYDIKERRIYDYTVTQSEIIIKVAPENVSRFSNVDGENYGWLGTILPFNQADYEDIYYDPGNGEYYIINENEKEVIYTPYEENYCEEVEVVYD